MDKQIKKQFEFVEWLKSHGIYNEFASAETMRGMMKVWEICGDSNHG